MGRGKFTLDSPFVGNGSRYANPYRAYRRTLRSVHLNVITLLRHRLDWDLPKPLWENGVPYAPEWSRKGLGVCVATASCHEGAPLWVRAHSSAGPIGVA